MNARCTYETDRSWKWYGGRGIEVCERWRFGTPDAFANFYADMGIRPDGMQIDRIDSDGNYEPSNCRWVTASTNIRNRRDLGNYGRPRKTSRPQT